MSNTIEAFGGAALAALLELAEHADEAELLAETTQHMAELLGAQAACIVTGGMPRVVAVRAAGAMAGAGGEVSEALLAGPDDDVDLEQYPEVREAVASREVVLLERSGCDPQWVGLLAQLPPAVGAAIAVPLVAGSFVLGAVVVRAPVAAGGHSLRTGAGVLATARALGRLAGHLVSGLRSRARETAEIPPGDGALFETEPPARGAAGLRRRRPARVLLIEDDSSHAAIVAAVLERRGFEVEIAINGADGIARAAAASPDLILLDVFMPRLDGFSTAEALQSDPRLRDIPMVFVSACDDAATRVRGLEMGAVDFLCKPFFAPELVARVERSLRQAEVRSRLRAQAHIDDLTGLGNLRYLRERLAQEESRARRYGTPLAVVMIDLDKFKEINDRFGHAAGDAALTLVGRVLRDETRETDIAARYGGDEFMVVLPHASLTAGVRFAERVAERIRRLRSGEATLTASFGVSIHRGGDVAVISRCGRGPEWQASEGLGEDEAPMSLDEADELSPRRPELAAALSSPGLAEVMARADAAVYRAKRAGGNRVVTDDAGEGERSGSGEGEREGDRDRDGLGGEAGAVHP
ncbi:MAG TPA: diguanylate cyclase [Polyangia bacterium]|jgi:diguanylate cyclase (GGDEF)-like protein|nr:diguanylate cyclase [Polyangia bacterium]